jgi:hypothetical protein
MMGRIHFDPSSFKSGTAAVVQPSIRVGAVERLKAQVSAVSHSEPQCDNR